MQLGGATIGPPHSRNTKSMWEKNPFRWTGKHTPSILKKGKYQVRKRCLVCGDRTGTRCNECGIYLCLEVEADNQKSHWQTHHSRDTLSTLNTAATEQPEEDMEEDWEEVEDD